MENKIKKVLILGSAALKIGEAGEFDYSGSQAIKALKEEGITTILVNPNIATIQTSDYLADQIYFLPVNAHFVEAVIKKERPDAILLSFGGQTALNCGLELAESGVLEKHQVSVLGTPIHAIKNTEDRDLFVKKLSEIHVKVPQSQAVTTVQEAVTVAENIGYPAMVRIAYALGGLGSGVCQNQEELSEQARQAFSYTSQILIEEYLGGWKEVEYEVVRDQYNNCVTVCNMENFDPMGIHTGESIVVAPSQTLSNREYHLLREVAIRVIRHLGIVGECNIQYALSPDAEDYRIIEVNARLSRSSALASKATGYPLAFIAAKLALGYGLHQLPNSVTQTTRACFEPALDYVVVKIPRWDLKKFKKVSRRIGSAMKSVGEVMSIGRSFEEAFQKAIRMLEIGASGLVLNNNFEYNAFETELSEPTEQRIFAIAEAMKNGFSIERIHEHSRIDKWFLYKIKNIVDIETQLLALQNGDISTDLLLQAKQAGFSDVQISRAVNRTDLEIRAQRKEKGIIPSVKQIDTLAAEYPAKTNYLYLTYNAIEDDLEFPETNAVIVLGSGAYRIGSSVEFDWCGINAINTLRKLGYHTVMLNYNPETVSTDYDECDKLFFDQINLETVLDVYEKQNPIGIIISMGGQIPNNLAMKAHQAGIKILGTSPESIDNAENRHKFSALLDRLGIDQPEWNELSSPEEAKQFAHKVGYPVLVRPSYVLSGASMGVASNDTELYKFLSDAVKVSPEHPIVVSKFLENAKEIEIDAVAQDGKIVVYAISEHVENAGVHSGDATMVLPPQRTFLETVRQAKKISAEVAEALKINGPFNIQFLARQNKVKVIECNLRASRSFPFVSKILKTNFIETATRIIMGQPINNIDPPSLFEIDYVGVKAPQFSFTRLQGADPTLGVEMASTGEVGCLGDDFEEAFLKALISVGYKLPIKTVLLSTGTIVSKAEFLESTLQMQELGIKFYATQGTAEFMRKNGIESTVLHWPLEKAQPNTIDYIKEGKIDLVINIPKNYQEEELTNDYIIRRMAVNYAVPLITNIQLAMRLVESISKKQITDLQIKSWKEYLL